MTGVITRNIEEQKNCSQNSKKTSQIPDLESGSTEEWDNLSNYEFSWCRVLIVLKSMWSVWTHYFFTWG